MQTVIIRGVSFNLSEGRAYQVYLMRIALRNLLRRRKRTLLIAGILMLAVLVFLFLESFMMGIFDLSFDNMIDFETPHITVGRAEYFAEIEEEEEISLEETFVPEPELLDQVQELQGFSALTEVLDFNADFIAGRYDYPVLVRAIELDSFVGVFKNQEYLVEGEFIEPGDEGVVIGSQLARFFDLEVGDFYTLRFQDKAGSFNTLQGEVRGIVTVPHPEMNMSTVFVSRSQAAAALGLEEGQISQLMVRMAGRDQAREQAEFLQGQLTGTGFVMRSYRDASDFLTALEIFGYVEIYFILVLFLMVGAIGIISALVLAALERVEEIGMMKALGLKRSQIVRVFLLEAAGIGMLGGAAGLILGAISVGLLANLGINLDLIMEPEALGLPMAGQLYGSWNLSSFLLIFVFVVILAVVASVVPAYWAASKNPADAIHHR